MKSSHLVGFVLLLGIVIPIVSGVITATMVLNQVKTVVVTEGGTTRYVTHISISTLTPTTVHWISVTATRTSTVLSLVTTDRISVAPDGYTVIMGRINLGCDGPCGITMTTGSRSIPLDFLGGWEAWSSEQGPCLRLFKNGRTIPDGSTVLVQGYWENDKLIVTDLILIWDSLTGVITA